MKKLIIFILVHINLGAFAQVNNATPTRFTNGILVPNGVSAPYAGAGSLWYQNNKLAVYNFSIGAWQNLLTETAVSGTANYIPKFTSSTAIGDSRIFDDGTHVGIGTASPLIAVHAKVGTNKNFGIAPGALSGVVISSFNDANTAKSPMVWDASTHQFFNSGAIALSVVANVTTVTGKLNIHETSTTPTNGDMGYNTVLGNYIFPNVGTDYDFTLHNGGGSTVMQVPTGTQNVVVEGNLTAANLSGTNTGDQDLSEYVNTTTNQTKSGKLSLTGGYNFEFFPSTIQDFILGSTEAKSYIKTDVDNAPVIGIDYWEGADTLRTAFQLTTGGVAITKQTGAGPIIAGVISNEHLTGTKKYYLPDDVPAYESVVAVRTDIPIKGSFSGAGTATTTFTVAIGTTMANTNYEAFISAKNTLSAAMYYIPDANKTTTTFDVIFLTGLTGSVSFGWSLFK